MRHGHNDAALYVHRVQDFVELNTGVAVPCHRDVWRFQICLKVQAAVS